MRDVLKTFGLQPVRREIFEEFVFGDGEVDKATVAWIYPVFFDGKFVGVLDIAECTAPCPTLFSINTAKRWQIVSDHGRQSLYLGAYDKTFAFQDGTPYIDIFELDPKRI